MGPSRTVPSPARMNPAASQRAEGPKLLSLWEELDCMKGAACLHGCYHAKLKRVALPDNCLVDTNMGTMMEMI
jgi:hypothetical protein